MQARRRSCFQEDRGTLIDSTQSRPPPLLLLRSLQSFSFLDLPRHLVVRRPLPSKCLPTLSLKAQLFVFTKGGKEWLEPRKQSQLGTRQT